MRRKLYWGIAVLIVILFTAGVFLLTQRNIDMEPDVVFEPPSPEVIQRIKDDLAERHAQDAAKPPPPGASPNGHWHDGVWHDEPHDTPAQVQRAQPVREISAEDMPSASELAAYHKYMKEMLPGRIEQVRNLRDALQKSYDLSLRLYQRDPDNEAYRKMLLEDKEQLDSRNLELSSLTKLWREKYENE